MVADVLVFGTLKVAEKITAFVNFNRAYLCGSGSLFCSFFNRTECVF